jgi:cytochrome oxidase Cu insertion factor (SCO1/SenC/PrrC family)
MINKKNQIVVIFMALIFVAPLLIVMLMYRYNWHPKSYSYGELIKPIVNIDVSDLFENTKNKSKETQAIGLMQDKWSLVYLTDECTSVCESRLYDLRQIHVSFDKDIPRVQRILITSDKNISKIHEKYPDLIILNKPLEDVIKLSLQFDTPSYKAMNSDNVYVVDPMSNLMMLYSNKTKPQEIRKDIVRLLKYSWAG